MDKTDELLNRIENLPPAPKILAPLLIALTDIDADVSRVVDMIALDPALTAKVLQTCNSAYFGISRPVDHVDEAVNRLGFQIVYCIVAMASGDASFDSAKATGIDVDRQWRHAATAAFASQFIARRIGADAGLYFTAGLLHDIGKLILAEGFQRDYIEIQSDPGLTGKSLMELECASFGVDHAEVGARLLERWKFSPQFVGSVRYHHDPAAAAGTDAAQFATCLFVADALAHSLTEDEGQPAPEADLQAALKTLGMGEKDLARRRQEVIENMPFVEALCRMRG